MRSLFRLHHCILAAVSLYAGNQLCQAQVNYGYGFNFGFEGFLSNIPNYGALGVYNFANGNNTQRSPIPDYYTSTNFGWKIDGYSRYSDSTANWNNFTGSSTYLGNGQNSWGGTVNITADPISYPGNGGTTASFGEAFNVNRSFSPTGLPEAPGLGNQFMDIWGSHPSSTDAIGFSAQASLAFTVQKSTNLLLTLAFGGRDLGNTQGLAYDSANRVGYYRLLDGATVIASGSTNNYDSNPQPFEYWMAATGSAVATKADAATLAALETTGVSYRNWEYYQLGTASGLGSSAITLQTGHTYQLQIMLPDELNFDIVLGSDYSSIPPIPEPSTYALLGAGALAGLAALRRYRRPAKTA